MTSNLGFSLAKQLFVVDADFQCEASPISCVLSTLNSEIRSLVVIRTLNVREEITSDKFSPQTLTSDNIYNSILRHGMRKKM